MPLHTAEIIDSLRERHRLFELGAEKARLWPRQRTLRSHCTPMSWKRPAFYHATEHISVIQGLIDTASPVQESLTKMGRLIKQLPVLLASAITSDQNLNPWRPCSRT